MSLRDVDPEISRIIELEKMRQTETIDLIASENHASSAVLEAPYFGTGPSRCRGDITWFDR